MLNQSSKKTIKDILKGVDVEINGSRPWDIQVKNEDFYSRILAGGSLALGESYMDGSWECRAIDQLIVKFLSANLDKKIRPTGSFLRALFKAWLFNQQRKSKAHEIGEKHYDIGNDLYKNMLGQSLNYSCGYWRKAKILDQAQIDKMDLICKKLELEPDMTLLDIGCGWGSLAKFAAEKYKAKVVGITVSKEQAKLAQELNKGLDVEIRLEDYRDIKEKFDRVVSVGMFEHVGAKNYRTYFRAAGRVLKNNGLFLLHTIAGNRSAANTDSWIDKYIFPNSLLPSAKQITSAYEGIFRLEDWHNFGPDYDKTLMAWHENFNRNWDKIKDNYSQRFKRMWNYYLLACAGSFRAGKNQLWQIVFRKIDSIEVGYESIR